MVDVEEVGLSILEGTDTAKLREALTVSNGGSGIVGRGRVHTPQNAREQESLL